MTEDPYQQKTESACEWVSEKLSYDGGPKQGRTAIIVVRLDDVPGDEKMGYTNVFCLPDIHIDHLIEGLEKFIGDLKSSRIDQPPVGEPIQ